MEKFSEEVRAAYGRQDHLDSIEERLLDFHRLKVEVNDGLRFSIVAPAPSRVFDLVQIGVYRTLELGASLVSEANAGRWTTACLIARAMLETGCLIYDAIGKVERAVKEDKGEALDELDAHLRRVFLGSKEAGHRIDPEIEAINVITVVKRASEEFEGTIWWFYSLLSEHAHPNYHGMFATYTELRGKVTSITKFTTRRSGRIDPQTSLVIGAAGIALVLMQSAYERFGKIKVPLAELAERRVYEAGTWPDDVEYPIHRGAEDEDPP